MAQTNLLVRSHSTLEPYLPIFKHMQQYTQSRTKQTPDELWFLEHTPVFTQGLAGRSVHLLQPHPTIPVIQTDRGGQITYHGPGQLMAYTLLDITRLAHSTRTFVRALEQTVIETLQFFDIVAHSRVDAPGVYVNDQKIASLGLRIKKGFAYHGVAFNITTDLTPFAYINPCGYSGLKMTTLQIYVPAITRLAAETAWLAAFQTVFGYTTSTYLTEVLTQK